MKKVLALVVIAGSITLFSCGGEKKADDTKAADSIKNAKAADSMKQVHMKDSMDKAKADTSKKAVVDTMKKDADKMAKDADKMKKDAKTMEKKK